MNRIARTLVGLASVALSLGCPNYGENEPDPDGGRPPPVVHPGDADPEPGFPGSGHNGDPGTGVLWLVRVDRSTANLAVTYKKAITQVNNSLRDQGFTVSQTAVASLYTGNLIWANGRDIAPVELEVALSYHAARAPTAVPQSCPTAGLANLAQDLAHARLEYPIEWVASNDEPQTVVPFEFPVGALLIGILDHGDRPVSFDALSCTRDGANPAVYFGNHLQALWLNTAAYGTSLDGGFVPGMGWTLKRLHTRFLMIPTAERVAFEAERQRCVSISGFPREALDAIEPSELGFYDGFQAGLANRDPELAVKLDFCEGLGGRLGDVSKTLATNWVTKLKASMKVGVAE